MTKILNEDEYSLNDVIYILTCFKSEAEETDRHIRKLIRAYAKEKIEAENLRKIINRIHTLSSAHYNTAPNVVYEEVLREIVGLTYLPDENK